MGLWNGNWHSSGSKSSCTEEHQMMISIEETKNQRRFIIDERRTRNQSITMTKYSKICRNRLSRRKIKKTRLEINLSLNANKIKKDSAKSKKKGRNTKDWKERLRRNRWGKEISSLKSSVKCSFWNKRGKDVDAKRKRDADYNMKNKTDYNNSSRRAHLPNQWWKEIVSAQLSCRHERVRNTSVHTPSSDWIDTWRLVRVQGKMLLMFSLMLLMQVQEDRQALKLKGNQLQCTDEAPSKTQIWGMLIPKWQTLRLFLRTLTHKANNLNKICCKIQIKIHQREEESTSIQSLQP